MGDHEERQRETRQPVERAEGDADVALARGGHQQMFRRENGHEQRLARPQQRPLRTIAAEPQERAHADRMERHADRERRAQRKPLGNGVQAVRAVVVGVLQGIDDVESPAPRQHEQRQHARLPVETPRQGDKAPTGAIESDSPSTRCAAQVKRLQ